ncbi:MAG TPA: XRE family transcriptional regulator [Bryobacteraceae bacterium]|jgi:Zn-dependent peptidase ImmA (M78 family)/DNA-binding XRE family transcriptional regulator
MRAAPGLGARLRQARDLADYSQQEIADLLGTAREVVSYWENDRRVPSYGQLARLAETYGVTTGSLLGTEPPPVVSEEHELLYRGLRTQKARMRAAVGRWLAFLDDWADLQEACGAALPGRFLPPKREWRAARAITDSRLAPRLAEDVRAYYELGADAIPDLLAFLDSEGVLVYRAALDRIDEDGVSGIYYNHPRLGSCILVNTSTTPGRQTFTLAHEFAHALFHYQARGLVSRAGDPGRTERFADAFAAHFLVPGEALRKRVGGKAGKSITPVDVIDLHRYFRVSYATMLIRLRSEGLLPSDLYELYRGYSPSHLAARLGLPYDEYIVTASAESPEIALSCYPASILDRICLLVNEGEVSPAAAADLLQVSLEEVFERLLATPDPATPEDQREFAELPDPMTRRGRETASA